MKLSDITNIKILDGQDMYKLVEKNPTVFSRIRYLVFSEISREIHFVAFDKKKIIAVGGLEESPYEKDILWIKHISVDPDYQGQRIATSIMERFYQYAMDNNKKLKHSSFTKQGQRLKPIVHRFDQKYPGVSIDEPLRDFVT